MAFSNLAARRGTGSELPYVLLGKGVRMASSKSKERCGLTPPTQLMDDEA